MADTITRPNGKVWRGRLPVRVREFTDIDWCTGIVVLGTQDAWEATVLAANLIAEYELRARRRPRGDCSRLPRTP